MARPAKKRRASEPIDEVDVRGQTESVLGKLTETLEALESSDPSQATGLSNDVSRSFLKLKSLQRMVLEKLHGTQRTLEEQRQRRDEQELKLENLKYQKVLNEHSIQVCQSLETSQLLQLCCDEMEQGKPESTEETETMMQEFLEADPQDPAQRATIVAKLNLQVNTRGMLETELKMAQHKTAKLKHSLAAKRKLLQELPLKLHDLERASLPLQKFCQKSLNATHKLGSERRTCLDLAQSLPKALYTLYYQLQSCLDTMETSDDLSTPESSPSLEIDKESSVVVFQIPIPSVSDGSATFRIKKVVSISFEYNTEWDMVTAHCSKDNDMGDLISELFPGDTGEYTGDEETETDSQEKRPYHWCNYLAGLHVAPAEQSASKAHLSTRVVVRALTRRVRATATLYWLLHSLSRKPHPIPVHPSMKSSVPGSNEPSVKISHWTEEQTSSEDDSSKNCRVYLVTLKRKAATLSVRAQVNIARYPAVPPTWEILVGQPSSGELEQGSALYDDPMATLERRVNGDVEQLVVPTEEATYDWILSHQLAEIANGWEEILSNNASAEHS
jgi:hypothetical protein